LIKQLFCNKEEITKNKSDGSEYHSFDLCSTESSCYASEATGEEEKSSSMDDNFDLNDSLGTELEKVYNIVNYTYLNDIPPSELVDPVNLGLDLINTDHPSALVNANCNQLPSSKVEENCSSLYKYLHNQYYAFYPPKEVELNSFEDLKSYSFIDNTIQVIEMNFPFTGQVLGYISTSLLNNPTTVVVVSLSLVGISLYKFYSKI